MKTCIYSVFDKATMAYMRPWSAMSDKQAVRMFEDLVHDDQTDISKHPEDYSLHKIAEFTDHDGRMEPLDEPLCLRRAHEVERVVIPMENRKETN